MHGDGSSSLLSEGRKKQNLGWRREIFVREIGGVGGGGKGEAGATCLLKKSRRNSVLFHWTSKKRRGEGGRGEEVFTDFLGLQAKTQGGGGGPIIWVGGGWGKGYEVLHDFCRKEGAYPKFIKENVCRGGGKGETIAGA